MSKRLRPAIDNHKTPKMLVTVFEWLYIALTRTKNRNEVAGPPISKNIPWMYRKVSQLSIGATVILCQSVDCTTM